jgi:hypothetical protein
MEKSVRVQQPIDTGCVRQRNVLVIARKDFVNAEQSSGTI